MPNTSNQRPSIEEQIEKIRRFAADELNNMLIGSLPICYQIGSDVLIVGNYKIQKIDSTCWRIIDSNNCQLFDFFTRKNAIYFCVALHKHRRTISSEIQVADKLINELEFSATLYRYLFKKATNNKDEWNSDVYSSKYIETMLKLSSIKKQLTQNFKLSIR